LAPQRRTSTEEIGDPIMLHGHAGVSTVESGAQVSGARVSLRIASHRRPYGNVINCGGGGWV